MRLTFLIVFLSISFPFTELKGQTGQANHSAQIEKLYGRLAAVTADVDRIRINDSIVTFIDSYVRSDSIFRHNFRNIRYLGQITSPDAQLKIVTWNLLLRDTTSEYYCYLILKSGKENKIYKLTADYKAGAVRTDTIYSDKTWYGALYYDLRPLKKEKSRSWILLGIDYGNPLITRKIIDVLTFTPDGGLTFGRKWFVAGNEIKFREVLEYSHTAVITLRFLSERSIVFDHLVPVDPAMKGNREFYAPDFSYDSYEFEKGVWNLKVDVDVRNKRE